VAKFPAVVARAQPDDRQRIGKLVELSEDDPEGEERYSAFRRRFQKLQSAKDRNIRIPEQKRI
jgi:hypothetical protein